MSFSFRKLLEPKSLVTYLEKIYVISYNTLSSPLLTLMLSLLILSKTTGFTVIIDKGNKMYSLLLIGYSITCM
jgi:hypothetical protein